MTNNCLVTKLKSEANNNGLSNLGEIRCKVSTSAVFGLIWSDGSSVLSNVYTEDAGVSFSASGAVLTVSGSGTFYIKNKYKLTSFTILSGDAKFADLSYCPIIGIYLGVEQLSGLTRLSQLNQFASTLTNLSIRNSIFEGQSIGDISALINITTIEPEDSKLVATMKQFADFLNLTQIKNTRTMTITGSIEDFVAVRKHAGQSTGSVAFFCIVHTITFNNSDAFASSTIEWSANGDNTVVNWNNGTTTIHVNSDGTWTRV